MPILFVKNTKSSFFIRVVLKNSILKYLKKSVTTLTLIILSKVEYYFLVMHTCEAPRRHHQQHPSWRRTPWHPWWCARDPHPGRPWRASDRPPTPRCSTRHSPRESRYLTDEWKEADLLLSLERGVEVELLEMATGQQQTSGVRGSVVGQTNLKQGNLYALKEVWITLMP